MTATAIGFVFVFLFIVCLSYGYISLACELSAFKGGSDTEFVSKWTFDYNLQKTNYDVKLLFDYLDIEKVEVPEQVKLQPKRKKEQQ